MDGGLFFEKKSEMKTYISNDVESDGPVPELFSMIAFGAVVVEETFSKTFGPVYLKPISAQWDPKSLAISGFSREQTLNFNEPKDIMNQYFKWLSQFKNPIFISDNNGYDWSFINYYFWKYIGSNPYGFSSQNINSLYKGFSKNMNAGIKLLKKTISDHNPLNDAKGNAEAMFEILKMIKDEKEK